MARAIALMVRSRRCEILLEAHGRRAVGAESVVARTGLALGARERVLLVGLGMQEYRKVAPHLLHSLALQFLRGSADDHPVALLHCATEQLIPDCTADQIHFHADSLPREALHRYHGRDRASASYLARREAQPICRYRQDSQRRQKLAEDSPVRVASRTGSCIVAALANGSDHCLRAAPGICTVGGATRLVIPV